MNGIRVLFDLNSESYRVLDPIGSVMWSALVGERDWMVARKTIVDGYDVRPDVLDADFEAFALKCRAERILDDTSTPSDGGATGDQVLRSEPPRGRLTLLPGTMRAVGIFYQTWHMLSRKGFRTTYECYGRLPSGSARRRLPRALAMFGRAEHLFVAKRAPNDCIVRSLSLFRLLREELIPAEHVIGVSRLPFQAHAWVECDGRPILDERAHSGAFTPIARLAVAP